MHNVSPAEMDIRNICIGWQRIPQTFQTKIQLNVVTNDAVGRKKFVVNFFLIFPMLL